MKRFKQMVDILDERRRILLDELHPEFVVEQKDFQMTVLMHMIVDEKKLSIEELRELKGHVREIDEFLRRI